jgi:hypothetical protein
MQKQTLRIAMLGEESTKVVEKRGTQRFEARKREEVSQTDKQSVSQSAPAARLTTRQADRQADRRTASSHPFIPPAPHLYIYAPLRPRANPHIPRPAPNDSHRQVMPALGALTLHPQHALGTQSMARA